MFCFAVSAYDFDRNKLIKILLPTIIIPALFVIILRILHISSFADVITKGHYVGTTRDALGFEWPNCLPYIFITICMLYILLREDKLTVIELVIIMLINILVYHFTQTRNCLLTVSIIVVSTLFLKYNKYAVFDNIFKYISVLSFMLFSGFIIIFSTIYDSSIHWLLKLNNIVSGRLHLSNLWIVNNGISFLGREARPNFEGYAMIDSGYMGCYLFQGILLFIIVIFIYTLYTYIASKNYDKYLILSLLVCAYYSTFDHMLLNTGNNPLFLFFFSVLYKFLDLRLQKLKK